MILSFIDIRVLLCLLASHLLLCSAILWYFSHLPFLCPVSCSLRPIMPVPRCHHGSSMEVCFSSSFILILLLAPFPMPMPAPAQVLTGWHCANLPPPSLSFVAHPSVALPPVSSFPSLSFPLISFIYFLTKKNPKPLHIVWNTLCVGPLVMRKITSDINFSFLKVTLQIFSVIWKTFLAPEEMLSVAAL